MTPGQQDKPIEIKGFNGLWSRGLAETCPPDHLQACQNCIFPGPGQVSIRESVTISTTTIYNIIAYAIVQLVTQPTLLTLDSNGNFYDATRQVTLRATISGTPDDFVALCVFGRAYITFKYRGRGLTGDCIWYYDGTNLRQAGGLAPTTAPTLNQTYAGAVTAGVHLIAVSFQSPTGYLSPPSPVGTITSDGAHDIEISAIPVDPLGIAVARVILMTQANQTELFFVPGGVINDNTTTALNIDPVDTALITSADYLNDVFEVLPACSAIKLYNGRLVYLGPVGSYTLPSGSGSYTYPDNVLVSNQLSPETVNSVTGIVNMPVDYGMNNTNTAAIIRAVLYCMKPNGTYEVQDNGNDPSTWAVSIIDSGLGTYEGGLSTFASSASAQDILDQCFVVNTRGLLLFSGSYNDPPLTYKVEGVWQTLDRTKLHLMRIAHDPYLKRVYILIPTTGAFAGWTFLMGDYSEGLSPLTIKWSLWSFPWLASGKNVVKLVVENFSSTYGTSYLWQLTFCCNDTNIYKVVPPASTYTAPLYADLQGTDSFHAISQVIQTANFGFGSGISQFNLLGLDLVGVGSLVIYLSDRLTGYSTTVTGFNLSTYNPTFLTASPSTILKQGSTLFRGINFLSDGLSITLLASGTVTQTGYSGKLNSMFQLSGIKLYGKEMFKLRPALVQAT